ncbi:uncharacterized protein LOC130827861 isoform X2 [Amaranthus tricolor]|uniref:uncharacterized protein LOC130827861 isoform X2 n=1 Tax=Amaranthus tricolor TaxID=29722 RepID=UPI002583D58D|nr:uncharacterized protein LOC130827861 isoform X2 [Amaranthus tricolor]
MKNRTMTRRQIMFRYLELPAIRRKIKDLRRGLSYSRNGLGFSSEDEVEVPDFHKSNVDCNVGSDSISSKPDGSSFVPDEWMSDVKKRSTSSNSEHNVSAVLDRYTKGNENQVEPCTSSAVYGENRRLEQMSKNAGWLMGDPLFLEDKNLGGMCTAKRRLSRSQERKQGAFSSVWKDKNPNPVCDDELLDDVEACDDLPIDYTSLLQPEKCDGKTSKSSLALQLEAVVQQDHHRHSMAERFDNLRGRNTNLLFKSKKESRRKGLVRRNVMNNMSASAKDVTSDEDPCEDLHSESSTDNEDNGQSTELAVVESEWKTMADKFQEAFECASMDALRPFVIPKQSRSGLFGRLQHIMLEQKEQDAEFSKKVQTEVWPKDEAKCIDVKILSRSFEAKLSVCCCSLVENEENSLQNPQQERFGKMWTVIFSSRVCGDVDLDVGNLIRIHPPCFVVGGKKGRTSREQNGSLSRFSFSLQISSSKHINVPTPIRPQLLGWLLPWRSF